ncbi:hypothetical protein B0O99DRAFT_602148 [Bisporella sp. PMI_857]|nr:hypothetical protein B0O99DRAFT_602148 [Bisporella sp. PMI_857]
MPQTQFSPQQQQPHHNLDPNLMPHMMQQSIPTQTQSAHLPQRMRGVGSSPVQGGSLLQPGPASYQLQQNMWPGGYDQPMQDQGQGHSPSDTWSNGSAQAVPTTVNVEDWFQFFGLNGDLSGLNGDVPLA